MHQLILDNQNFIYYLFNLTCGCFYLISYLTGFTYEFWNVLAWFGLIPALWIYMISKKTTPYLNLLSVALFIIMFGIGSWIKWFYLSVDLLIYTTKLFGPNYRQMSVYLCLFAPLLITIGLAHFCLSRRAKKIVFFTLAFSLVIILIGFPVSNHYLPKYAKQIESTTDNRNDLLNLIKE